MDKKADRIFRTVRHFSDLPEAIRVALASAATRHTYAEGQVIYVQGDPATAIYFLEQGWVKSLRVSRQGREQGLLFLRPGEIFGDVAVFTGIPYPATVVALEPVQAWRIEAQRMLDLAARHPALAFAVTRRFGERILYFVETLEDMTLRSLDARLAHNLLRQAELADGQLRVPRRPWTTFDEMATRLGTVRDVLSRTLHNLEDAGLIRVERESIVILDENGLRERGEGEK